ncbi:MAG TPA: SDR family oxidoreductase [Solirubrobacteraceae bacterium]|nr:SDR family oxidoreductase [Solirubrobacteraceae bacterium]
MTPQATDPKHAHPTPNFPEQEQEPPGREADMKPLADHGEHSYVGHGRLRDNVALITGGDSGIGRAVALAFAREGADVLCSYWKEDDDAAETKQLVEEAGRRCLTVPGDIGDREHSRALVEQAVGELGRLDVLVNNAAYQMSYDSFLDIPPDEIEFVFRTNIIAMFHLCQAAVPVMEAGSTIINTTSIQAADPTPALLHYASTKGAISTFTKGLAQEVAERGIRVNAVAPGPIWTPLVAMSFPGEKNAQFGGDTPLGRPGQPGELAPLYVFLATEDSQYISGEVIGATGGKPLH